MGQNTADPNLSPPPEIERRVKTEILLLAPHLRVWAEAHLVKPREFVAALDPTGHPTATFWLVTDNTGTHDAAYRVVFDPREASFGTVVTLENGIHWFLRHDESFSSAIENM
jgi:hypothetical protein